MSEPQPGPQTGVSAPDIPAIVTRAKNLMLKPTAEWEKIASERANVQGLFTGYVAPLAALPALCWLLGGQMFGYEAAGIVARPSPVLGAVQAVLLFAILLAIVYLTGLVIDFLAENFDARRDKVQAMKVAAYSATAFSVAGVFGLFPPLALPASIAGAAYSVFLLFRGLPPVMKTTEEKALGYASAAVVAALVMFIVLSALASCANSWV